MIYTCKAHVLHLAVFDSPQIGIELEPGGSLTRAGIGIEIEPHGVISGAEIGIEIEPHG